MVLLAQRTCFARGCLCPPSRTLAVRCRAARKLECSSLAACSQAGPSGQPPSLVQRLAATLQRAATAFADQRAAASLQLHRLLQEDSSSSYGGGGVRQRLGGLAMLAAAAAGPVGRGGSILSELSSNYVFVVGFCGWFLAQSLKIFTKAYKTGVWDVRAILDSGGMPSSHSALCSSVSTAIAMQQGLGSPLFAICVCFSVIVMYDAMGVRRHAGLQAELLNIVASEVLEGHPKAEQKLKEVLGHTPRQVYAGLTLGVLVGLLFPQF